MQVGDAVVDLLLHNAHLRVLSPTVGEIEAGKETGSLIQLKSAARVRGASQRAIGLNEVGTTADLTNL